MVFPIREVKWDGSHHGREVIIIRVCNELPDFTESDQVNIMCNDDLAIFSKVDITFQ